MNEYDQRYARFAAETSGWGEDFMRSLRTLYGQAVALLMHGIDSLRRTQIRLIVRLALPHEVDADKLKDLTATNMHKLCLELYSGGALQAVRNSQLYRALRTRMEEDYLAIHGRPLPP